MWPGNMPPIFKASCHEVEMSDSEPVVEAVYRKLGGRRVLGTEIASEADLVRVVLGRIPLKALGAMQESGFSDREIDI